MASLKTRLEESRRFGSFPDVFFAAALLNPSGDCRSVLTSEEVSTARAVLQQFNFEADIVETDVPVPFTSASTSTNPIDMAFETTGFRTFANNDVQIKQTVFKNFEEEVTHFCTIIDDPRPAFKFFC